MSPKTFGYGCNARRNDGRSTRDLQYTENQQSTKQIIFVELFEGCLMDETSLRYGNGKG